MVLHKISMFLAVCILVGCASAPAPQKAAMQPVAAPPTTPAPAVPVETRHLDLQLAAGALTDRLMEQALLPADARVAVLPLVCPNGGTTTLGFLLAEKIAARLVSTKRCRVLDRTHLSAVIEEKDLAYTDMVSADQTKATAKLVSADYLMTGSLVEMGSQIELTAKLLNGGTGDELASAGSHLPRTPDVELMLAYVQRPKTGGGSLPPLSLSYNLFCRRGSQDVRLTDGSVVHSGDHFKIHLQASSDCYTYVLLLDSQGKASLLFPHARIPCGNAMKGGVTYEIPPPNAPADSQWYIFDQNPGTEQFFILASYEPISQMDNLLKQIEHPGDQLRESLADAESAYTKGMSATVDDRVNGGFQVQSRGIILGSKPNYSGQSGALHNYEDSITGIASVVRRIVIRHERGPE